MDYTKLSDVLNDYNKNNFEILKKNEETAYLYKTLLEKEIIVMQPNGLIKKKNHNNVYLGKLQIKGKFGFVVGDNELDHYVHKISNNMPGDTVLVIEKKASKGKSKEAVILSCVERLMDEVVCYVSSNLKLSIVNNHDMRMYKIVPPKNVNLKQYKKMYVKLKVSKVNTFKISGTISSVISSKDDKDIQTKLVLSEFNIEQKFNEEVEQKSKQVAKEDIAVTADRVDLTNHMFFTIDGEDAKDLDDAICLIKEGDNYRLFVSIADVSHYVTKDSLLDEEAFNRATSVYFVDRVIPMLPEVISNGICSLHPHVKRYTITCEMLINKENIVIDKKIYPSVINSNYKMTYEAVNAMLMLKDNELIVEYSDIYGILCEMNKLAKRLNENRVKRGSFNLDSREPKFEIGSDGQIVDVSIKVRYDAEKMIEEFMILANETIADTIYNMDLPFIYRIHEQPDLAKLEELQQIMKNVGVELKGDLSQFHSSSFKDVLDKVDASHNKYIISDLIVRSLKKAIYSPQNTGHFGLASNGYTHFTSPIRRYPDLIVHRLLRKYLFEKNYEELDVVSSQLKSIANSCSEKERNAVKAEYKIEEQKMAEYMQKYIGKIFIGKVASITDFGFFVELENTQRGLIKFKTLVDYVQVENFIIKFKNGKQLTIGDEIKVKLSSVDTNRGIIDFVPIELKSKGGMDNESHSKQQKSKLRVHSSKKNRSGNSTSRKRNKISATRKSKSKR